MEEEQSKLFRWIIRACLGRIVSMTVFNDANHRSEKYEGVLVDVKLDADGKNILEVSLEKCVRLSRKEIRDAVIEMKDRLVCPWKDIIGLDIVHNQLLGSFQTRSASGRDIMLTDSGISSGSKGRERELKRWGAGEEEGMGGLDSEEDGGFMDGSLDDSREIGNWDQFKANKNEFGVEMGFEESRYTSEVDKSGEFYRQHLDHADKIAKKIESSGSYSARDGEDSWGSTRGSKPKYADESEESIFSAVENVSPQKKDKVEAGSSSKDWRQPARIDESSMHASASGSSISSSEGHGKKSRKKNRKGRERERSEKTEFLPEKKELSEQDAPSPSPVVSAPSTSQTDVEQKLILQMGAPSAKETDSLVNESALKKRDGMFLRSSISSFQEILEGKDGLCDAEGDSTQKGDIKADACEEAKKDVEDVAVENPSKKDEEQKKESIEMEPIKKDVVPEEKEKEKEIQTETEIEAKDLSSEKTQETQTEPPAPAPAPVPVPSPPVFEFVPDASLPKLVLATSGGGASSGVPGGNGGVYGGPHVMNPAPSWSAPRAPPHSRGGGGSHSHSRYARGGGGYNPKYHHQGGMHHADQMMMYAQPPMMPYHHYGGVPGMGEPFMMPYEPHMMGYAPHPMHPMHHHPPTDRHGGH